MSREELEKYIKTAQCGRQIKYLIVHCSATAHERPLLRLSLRDIAGRNN